MPEVPDISDEKFSAVDSGAENTDTAATSVAAPDTDALGEEDFDELFFSEDDFDPLATDDSEIDQENMDDDNPWDTIDYPTMREMPEHMQREAVFTPESSGSARAALESLLDHNPARRGVLLLILDACRDGCLSSELTDKVRKFQENDYSVYEPMTLARMLERAGVLELTIPEVVEEHEDVDEGVEYLVINERVDPTWTTTQEGLEVYDEQTSGASFRETVLERDARYLEVYRAVMELIREEPRKPTEIEELVDTFDVVKHPRRFGGHFIDILERVDAIAWKDRAWTLTELGARMLDEMPSEAASETQNEAGEE